MEYAVGIAAVLLVAVLIGAVRTQREQKRKLIEKIKNGYGRVKDQDFTYERFESLKFYFKAHNNGVFDIDDITVNDVDLDRVFLCLNNTCSAAGEEYLYQILRKPAASEEVLKERDRVAEYFDREPDERLKASLILSRLGKIRNISLYEYLNRLNNAPTDSNLFHLAFPVLYVISAVLIVLGAVSVPKLLGIGVGLLIISVTAAIITYFKSKSEKDIYYNVILNVVDMIRLEKEIRKLSAKELEPYVLAIESASGKLSSLSRFSFMLTSGGGNIADLVLDYVRMLTHLDLVKFNNVIKIYRENIDSINILFENYGFLDSMIAVASFRAWLKNWSKPEFITDRRLEVTELYHPLIEDPVKNSVEAETSVLLTGSNASGKSTFIKALAINSILAQTVYTCTASSYRAPFFKIMSSMALRDDLESGESYYMVEIKSLKRILDSLSDDHPVLCFVDEVLRGTNTLERIAASSRILYYLSKSNCLVFAATHDLELADILKNSFASYHFSEKIGTGDVEFDYLLKPGKADTRNAIRLLEKLDYPGDITKGADLAGIDFEKNNRWTSIE